MKRFVTIPVDEGTEHLSVWHWAGTDAHGPLRVEQVHVPSDDQLTRDLDALVGWAEAILDGKMAVYSGPKMRERFARLRARFGLDEGEES